MKDTELLSKEDELKYIALAKTDEKYRKIVISNFLRLVHSIARPYFKEGIDPEDLVQEGVQGLHRAIDDFQPKKDKRFATYARWWIRHFVTQYYRSNIRGFKISGNISGKLSKMNAVTERLEKILGRRPTNEEIAKDMGYELGYVNYLFNFVNNTLSLDEMMENSTTSQDPASDNHSQSIFLSDDARDTPYERVAREDSVLRVKACLDKLQEREKMVLTHRYGLNGEDPLTLEETGAILGITAEWVRQLQKVAEEKLKNIIYK